MRNRQTVSVHSLMKNRLKINKQFKNNLNADVGNFLKQYNDQNTPVVQLRGQLQVIRQTKIPAGMFGVPGHQRHLYCTAPLVTVQYYRYCCCCCSLRRLYQWELISHDIRNKVVFSACQIRESIIFQSQECCRKSHSAHQLKLLEKPFGGRGSVSILEPTGALTALPAPQLIVRGCFPLPKTLLPLSAIWALLPLACMYA